MPAKQSFLISHPRSCSQTAAAAAAEREPKPAQGWRCWSRIRTWESSQGAESAGAAAERQTPGPGESSSGLWGRDARLGGVCWRGHWSEQKQHLPVFLLGKVTYEDPWRLHPNPCGFQSIKVYTVFTHWLMAAFALSCAAVHSNFIYCSKPVCVVITDTF